MAYGEPMKLLAHLKLGAPEARTHIGAQQQEYLHEIHKHEDKLAKKQKERYDKKRKAIEFKKDDKVWLKVKDPDTFEKKRTGPFDIIRKVSELNYELGETIKGKLHGAHPIVHVSKLEKYDSHSAKRDEEEEDEEKQVREIKKHRKRKDGGYEFHAIFANGKKEWINYEDLIEVNEDGEIEVVTKALVDYKKKKQLRIGKKAIRYTG